jgi:hypothetical protein
MKTIIAIGVAAALCGGCAPGDDSGTTDNGRADDGGGADDATGREADARDDSGATDGDGTETGAEDGPADDGGADEAEVGPDPCAPIAGASYRSLSTAGPVTDRPPAEHADLNVKLRGWTPVGGTLGLVDIDGPTDTRAPKLYTFFPDDRVPVFVQNYAVYDWNWGTGSRGDVITAPEVTMTGFGTTAGEVLEVPSGGYDIGEGLQVRVLFADDDSITLKYTREDNVVSGYTLHVVGLCVEPTLRALYEANHAAGRVDLPALAGNQAFGRARSSEVLVSIRDTGSFMDPRSRKDWW